MNRAVRKYQRTTKGRRNKKLCITKWRANNRFNRDTIRLYKPFKVCESCPDDWNDCSVEQGIESIKECRRWQEYKHSGSHPFDKVKLDEPSYDPDYIDYEYIHDDT